MPITRRNAIISGMATLFNYKALGQSVITGRYRKPAAGSSSPVTVSAWPMDEGSGLTLNDVSGNANTALINTSAALAWTPNIIKSGVTSPDWNAGAGYALAGNASLTNFDGTAPFSVGAWIDSTAAAPQCIVGTLNPASSYLGWEVGLDASGGRAYAQVYINNTPGSNWIAVASTSSPVDGAVHYLAVTYDGSKHAAGVTIYVDGVATTTNITGDNLSSSAASGFAARLCERADGTDGYFSGIGYVQIVTGEWTAAQVATNFAAGPGIY